MGFRCYTGSVPLPYSVTQESFDSLESLRGAADARLAWDHIFILPAWMRTWWQELGGNAELYLGAVRNGPEVIGVAPLLLKGNSASLLGSPNVCDYLDFVTLPGREQDFFGELLGDLKQRGISQIDLAPLRPDSTALTSLVPMTRERGYEVTCQPDELSLELDLPPTWEDYLAILETKQRHELRRKLRRLPEEGKVDYHVLNDRAAINGAMDTFFKLFAESREDKARFLTPQMEIFFRRLVDAMAGVSLAKLGVLELDARPVAMVICFDYNGVVYLYNSGYDAHYAPLSVGLISKALCIKNSIEEGKKRFDFLKGNEAYKYHLGGKEVQLQSCRIIIK